MNKKYLILFLVWLVSVVAVGASIVFLVDSGIMAKFLPQKVMAECPVNDSVTIDPGDSNILRIWPYPRLECGDCSPDVGNRGEIAICKNGGACSGWGLEFCTHVGLIWYGWDCLQGF